MVRFLDTANDIDALRGEKVEDILADDESKRKFLGNLTESEFEELISSINGIIRGKNREDWKMDGGDVKLVPSEMCVDSEVIPPREEDKPELFKEVFAGVRAMNEARRSLEDIALLVAVMINEIHAFAEANGRTSRLVYTLFTGQSWGESAREKLKNVLSYKGRFHIDISPSLTSDVRDDFLNKELGGSNPSKNPENVTNLFQYLSGDQENLVFQEGISEGVKETFKRICQDRVHGCYAAFQILSKIPEKKSSVIKAYEGRSVILIDRLAFELTGTEIQEFIQEYWRIKRRKAEILIDLIVNPDKSEYAMEEDGKRMNILEYFKLRIKEEQEK